MKTLTEQDKNILRMLQGNLPDSLTPYADIAAQLGIEEDTVLNLIRRLRDEGVIRRFGASIKHQRTGWNANIMVAWKVDEKDADRLGKIASRHARISHCYFRPISGQSVSDWPYTLYTMIHGHSREECVFTVKELQKAGLPEECALLDSLKELKKTSMTYF